uniref:ANF_receptor domain-containing protein n=1 Tax=Meloidogyne hapla TaxID=6305 RepID=A0A1I8AWF9_MELHA
MSGPSYLLTREAISKILQYASQVKAIHLEDALFTGIIAGKANISQCGHWAKFNTFQKMSENLGCEDCVPLLITSVANVAINESYKELNNIACI